MSSLTLIAADARISSTAVRVALKLDQLGRRSDVVCHAAKTIAAALGKSVRTVYLALAQLEAAGYIRRARDYALRTRRRITLAWRSDAPPQPTPVSATGCAERVPPIALTSAAPLHPPSRALEREDDDDGIGEPRDAYEPPLDLPDPVDPGPPPTAVGRALETMTLARSSSSYEPNEGPKRRPGNEAPRKATKAEFNAVVAKAQAVYPKVFGVTWKVRRLAKTYRLSQVSVALDWAVYCKSWSWRFVGSTLEKAWKEDPVNGLDAPPVKRPSGTNLPTKPTPEPPPQTPDQVEADLALAREWAAGDHGPAMVRLGRLMLAKAGEGVPA